MTTVYRYDSVGNLLKQVTSGPTDISFDYSYNKNNYITGEKRAEGGKTTANTYDYDALGHLTAFASSTGYGENYAYDPVGNMLKKVITPAQGSSGKEVSIPVTLKMSYNKGNQLVSMSNGKDKLTYAYDKNGSMVEKVLSSKEYGKLTDTYAYNSLDQLTSYTGYDGYHQVFTYDAAGMRLNKSETGDGNRSTLEELLRGEIAGLPDIVAPKAGESVEDSANQVEVGYEWATTSYIYDITQEYYQVIQENTTGKSGSTTTAYTYGLERIAGYSMSPTGESSKTSYVYDGRGSVAQAITAPQAGESALSSLPDVSVPKIESFSYTAFGDQMNTAVKVSGFTYNAEQYDAATGMLNLRARQYEPAMNRFSQKDKLRGSVSSPVSLNRYAYVSSNPINYHDASGMLFEEIGKSFLGNAINSIVQPIVKTAKTLINKVKETAKNVIEQNRKAAADKIYELARNKGMTTEEFRYQCRQIIDEFSTSDDVAGIIENLNNLGGLPQQHAGVINEFAEERDVMSAGLGRNYEYSTPEDANPSVIDSILNFLLPSAKAPGLSYVKIVNEDEFYNTEPSYLEKSINQLIGGNYSEDVTVLGTGAQVATGILGIDLPADMRDITYDFTNWEWTWGHAGQTALDMVGVIPVIGAFKYTDEAASLFKHGDELADALGDVGKNADTLGDIGKNADEIAEGVGNLKISSNVFNHINNLHNPDMYAQQLKYKPKAAALKELETKTFFNSNWSSSKIQDAVNYGYNEAISKGLAGSDYTFKYAGESVTIVFENGTVQSAWGNYKYTYEYLLNLIK